MSGRQRPTRVRRADLSQHFLRDAPARRLVRATSISAPDLVVEIGPGCGALTKPLLELAGRLIAVELDAYLGARLQRELGERATVVSADFLGYELPAEPYCVVGNIPFARSTDIVRKLADAANPPHDAWLVVQRELAQRLCGRPFGPESLWSLRLKPRWHLEIVDWVPRREFDPPPSVDAAFLRMSLRGRPIVDDAELPRYLELLESAFTGGRPLAQALRPRLSKRQLRRLAADFRFGVDDRPGDLQFEQWLGIFRFVRSFEGTARGTRASCGTPAFAGPAAPR